MGRIPPGGWGSGPRRSRWGQPFDYQEPAPRPHYGLWWGLAIGSLLASFLLARLPAATPRLKQG